MPLYIGDYLADTSRLTTEQHGAYLLLLMDYWRSGRLPDNDQVLAQIAKLSPDAWSNARAMLEQFFSIENGFWIHGRVEKELAQSLENKAKNHLRAVQAAEKRWNKQPKDATSNANSNAQAMLKQCPSPSPSPSKNKDIYTDEFNHFWAMYPKHEDKQKAAKAFAKVKVPLAVITEALTKQIQAKEWHKKEKYDYIPLATTWLNGCRWEDSIVKSVSKENSNAAFARLAFGLGDDNVKQIA